MTARIERLRRLILELVGVIEALVFCPRCNVKNHNATQKFLEIAIDFAKEDGYGLSSDGVSLVRRTPVDAPPAHDHSI